MSHDYFPLDPRVYVRDELEMRQKRRPQYSMRAFARDLQISPSFLCEFLAGRQGLSRARSAWIGEKLKLSEQQTEHLWDLVQSRFGHPEAVRKAALFRVEDRAASSSSHLKLEHFYLVADWYCFLVLEILGLGKYSLDDVSTMIGVALPDVQVAVERLIKLGFLRVTDGVFELVTDNTTVPESVDDRALQISHQQTLRVHADAVDTKSFDARENMTIDFAVSESDWPQLRAELKKAVLDTISKFGNAPKEKDQVISFTMSALAMVPKEPEPQ